MNNTAYNTGFASGGLTWKLEALSFYSSSVLIDSFVLRDPPERKARNRYAFNWFSRFVSRSLIIALIERPVIWALSAS